ncbi:LysR family transcriptional regulator [Marinobacterium arenosum]|uniref:LysR family transcriptional regulator n=1 Tax=Marinobacterium arenosum TaxID=2862496 RepID=UPI001C94CAF0|nr:LysR family transcriptional regulator [Marinobacterium arenosum]MBY4675575.1 LysR family transcriptional regulator [Marinobacterium arenosum]
MNLRQMEAFRAVMMTGSVSQASQQLFKSQPAVSMLIKELEADVGFQLFERRKRRLYPTPEASYLYKEVEQIFNRIHDVSETVKDIANKQYGFLRIGCMPGPSFCFVPDILSDFLRERPRVRVSMQTRASAAVAERVASYQYDIGLAEVIGSASRQVDAEVFAFSCLCALPVDHSLADEPVIRPQMLDNEPQITLHSDHMTYHDLQKAFAAANSRMNVRLQTRFFLPALRFVERGLGVCVVDPMSVSSYRAYAPAGRLLFRPFEPDITMKCGILFAKGTVRSQMAEAFAERLREEMLALQADPLALVNDTV